MTRNYQIGGKVVSVRQMAACDGVVAGSYRCKVTCNGETKTIDVQAFGHYLAAAKAIQL